ncbi:5462_t:CDS:2, partial [Rhizophagus irregularis]
TSESVVKAGKVEISIKRGQKSELSIYDEAAGKSTKSQIPSNALKRIEPRVWSLDDFEMGSPLGVSVEKTKNLEHLVCYPEAEQGFQQVETEVIDAHLIDNDGSHTDTSL